METFRIILTWVLLLVLVASAAFAGWGHDSPAATAIRMYGAGVLVETFRRFGDGFTPAALLAVLFWPVSFIMDHR